MTQSSALVVGGTSGIGRACARLLAADGLAVTIVGRDGERAAAVAEELSQGVTGRGADVTRDESVAALFAVAPPDHVVVSLAGGSALGPFAQIDADAFRRALEVKLFGYLNVARHALRAIPAGGSLTFVTGVSGMRPAPSASCLAVANMAIGGLVETLAVEAAPIRVNAVAPGTTDTPAWSRMPQEARAALFDNMAAKTPLGRIAQPDDVAKAVMAVVRHEFLTGLTIPCDGGLRLT